MKSPQPPLWTPLDGAAAIEQGGNQDRFETLFPPSDAVANN
jgi:hypothetical protein